MQDFFMQAQVKQKTEESPFQETFYVSGDHFVPKYRGFSEFQGSP